MECKENRKFDLNNIADQLPEVAWAGLKKASDERDLEDFREVCSDSFHNRVLTDGKQNFKVYCKAAPNATFVDIEKKMREQSFNIYLIALVGKPYLIRCWLLKRWTGERAHRLHQPYRPSGKAQLHLHRRLLLQRQAPAC